MAFNDLCLNFDAPDATNPGILLTAGSFKTVASIKAPSDGPIKVKAVKLGASGIAGDAVPLVIRFRRVTPASGTGTSETPVRTNGTIAASPRSTCRINFTSEPTALSPDEILFPDRFHPQGGIANGFQISPFVQEEESEVALQIQVPTGQTAVRVTGHILFEE